MCLIFDALSKAAMSQESGTHVRPCAILVYLSNRDGCEEVRKDDLYNVPRFLNRVLALDVDHQNALFDHFVDLFDQTVGMRRLMAPLTKA